MSNLESHPETRKPRRRWLHYSLRSLLILVLLASIGMSWVAARMQATKRQSEAVAAIVELGGDVRYDYWFGPTETRDRSESPVPDWLRNSLGEDFFRTAVQVDLSGNAIGNEDLVHLERLPRLQSLRLSNTFVTDAGLRHLKSLTVLLALDLTSLDITDDGLADLTSLTGLRALELYDTEVTEAGVNKVKEALPTCEVRWEPPTEEERRSGLKGAARRQFRMQREAVNAIAALGGAIEVADDKVPNTVRLVRLRGPQVTDETLWVLENLASDLRIVDLRDSKITDEGLRNLRFMPRLEAICLQNAKITDTGLEHLEELPQLKALNLENTRVTETGVDKLRQRFKTCKITWKAPTPDERQNPAAPDQLR